MSSSLLTTDYKTLLLNNVHEYNYGLYSLFSWIKNFTFASLPREYDDENVKETEF